MSNKSKPYGINGNDPKETEDDAQPEKVKTRLSSGLERIINLFKESRGFEKVISFFKKKKVQAVTKVVVGALAVITALDSVYKVDQTQQALITQFGKPVRVILNPIGDKEERVRKLREVYSGERIKVSEGAGLKFKISYIQTVRAFDRRLLEWNGYPEQIPTKDKKYIWVDTAARWYIQDPLKFYRSVGTEEQAHAKLGDIIDGVTRNSITTRNLIEIVRTDNREMRVAEEELQKTVKVDYIKEGRPKIVAEITENSRKACEEYGIGIHELGILIKGLTYIEDVKTTVEDRMTEERLRIAKKYNSEGEGEYERIMGLRDREVKTILSQAYRTARGIEGDADSMAVSIYANGFTDVNEVTGEKTVFKGFNADPEFYRFLRTLQLYENVLGGEKTRLILGTDNPLYELIKGNVLGNSSEKKPSEKPLPELKPSQ